MMTWPRPLGPKSSYKGSDAMGLKAMLDFVDERDASGLLLHAAMRM
jgi:hypothetical protein